MNLGNVVSKVGGQAAAGAATNAAGTAASNVASSAASQATNATANAATNAVNGTSALKLDAAPTPNSNIPQNPLDGANNSNIVDFPGNDKPADNQDKLGEVLNYPGNENGNPNQQNLQPGDKVEPGKKVNEQGEVEDTGTKKTVKAVGRVAAAYFTGGESIGMDDTIANSRLGDKVIGVVSDAAEKTPGVKQVGELADELGVADGVNDALDAVGKAKNGDIKGAIDSTKKLKKDVDKLQKKVIMMVIQAALAILVPILFTAVIIVGVCGPVLGGFLDVVEGAGEVITGDGESETPPDNGGGNADDLINEIPGYEDLSPARQNILAAAAAAVSNNTPYNWGGHPSGPGLSGIPAAGLDCAGFVQWSLWTGLGTNPGYLTTSEISNRIGSDFIEISASELQPGDIGLKRRGGSVEGNTNHTGIYAGNGQWFHAANSSVGVIRGSYSSFTIYLRYRGVN